MSSVKPLAKKVALVTGGSRGIGKAICDRLARDGANVVVNYANSAADAEKTVADIIAAGGTAVSIKADISQTSEAQKLVDKTLETYGAIDILIHNAGVLNNQTLEEVTEKSFDESFGLNVKAPLFLTQAALPHLKKGSHILFVSTSLTAHSLVTPNYTLYVATKGALEQLARVFSKDAGKRGIFVNTISPGPTETELFRKGKTDQQMKTFASLSPFDRLGQPEDIANAVSFLVGSDSSWINGQNVRVNGGFIV